MTCIVGVEHVGGVTIGADCSGSSGSGISRRADAKLFQTGPYLMGFTSSFRMGQLLRYSLTPPELPARGMDRFMATTFIDTVRDCLQAGGFAETKDGAESGGTFLVGAAGHLYVVDEDYQVGRQINGYDAVGSGEPVALGSLCTTRSYDLTPKIRCRLALEAAAEHTTTVRGPFHIRTITA